MKNSKTHIAENSNMMKICIAVLFIVGFAIIVFNAADYLGGFFGWSWDIHLPSSAIGVVFLVVGMIFSSQFFGTTKPEPDKSRES